MIACWRYSERDRELMETDIKNVTGIVTVESEVGKASSRHWRRTYDNDGSEISNMTERGKMAWRMTWWGTEVNC